MLPLAFALALLSALWMVQHVARRYPSAPKRIPWRIELDGRPSNRLVGKWFLWVAPAAVVAVIAVLGVCVFVASPPVDDYSRSILALAFIVVAEVAYFLAWITDRQIELARKMTYRIAPARTWRAALPIILTTIVVLAVAARL
ncbi:MAG TPA: hypothetical protein VK665_02890 [Candidatus Elarobacter sp.]|nr:hypothetical protein [Candidatus Elarobacter sp.]